MLNFTQHPATPAQLKAGVEEPRPLIKEEIRSLLTFEEMPTPDEVQERAEALATLAASMEADGVLVGGFPALMGPLQRSLMLRGIAVFYAFSRRETVEEIQDDGSVRKQSIFKHLGFIPAELRRDDYYGDPITERSCYSPTRGCSIEQVF